MITQHLAPKHKKIIRKLLPLILVTFLVNLPIPQNSKVDLSPDFGIQTFEDNGQKADLHLDLSDSNIDVDNLPDNEITNDGSYDFISKLRDNDNSYSEIFNPWKSRGANHVAATTDDGEYLVVGGGYLLDTELHIYRWNPQLTQYQKVWEAGSGIISGDIYDLAFGDSDNNGLLEVAAASADGFVYLFEQAFIPNQAFTSLENKFDYVWKSDKLFQVSSVEFFDADLDGLQDLVVGSWDNKLHIFEYVSHSGYPFASEHTIEMEEKWVSSVLDDKVQSIAVGDFNGNELPEIMLGTFSGSLYIYENDGFIVTSPSGDITPLPNDNNYVQIWNNTGTDQVIWNTIGTMESGDVDSDGITDVVILGWGQGAWVMQYTQNEYRLEQLVVPFEGWQRQGPYPLDNFADWMWTGTDNPEAKAINVFVDPAQYSGSCPVDTPEPITSIAISCYTPQINSGGSEDPDGVYTEFRGNGSYGGQAVWDMGVEEKIGTNGNEAPDLYIVMPDGEVNIGDWNISLTNDFENWYYIQPNNMEVTSGTSGDTLAINLDPLFSRRQIEGMQYVRLQYLDVASTGKVDSIITPFVARPVTLAVSANIYPLDFTYAQDVVSNKILFGGTDGRIITYEKSAQTSLFHRDRYNINTNVIRISAQSYGLTLPSFSQNWDSFANDTYNTGETIWSIHPTPIDSVVPAWRYTVGSSPDFSVAGFLPGGTERVHDMSIEELYPYEGREVVVSSNNTDSLYFYNENLPGLALPQTLFTNVNTYPFNQYNVGPKILSFAFGELDSSNSKKELVVLPFYKDDNILGSTLQTYDPLLLPSIWKNSAGSGSVGQYNIYSFVQDTEARLYSFLSQATTYPSLDIQDLNGDGLNDMIISNGKLAVLWNEGTTTNPKFSFDDQYFNGLHKIVPSNPIAQPNLVDLDLDGDYDILYSYGRTSTSQRYGLNYYRNIGSNDNPIWERASEVVNRATEPAANMANNKFTWGTLDTITPSEASINALWVYSPVTHRVRKLQGEVGRESSFVIGTNPEIQQLIINKQEDSTHLNFGYTVTQAWGNDRQFDDWTLTMTTGELDGDGAREIIVSDFDNNVILFENLVNNTYKRAYKTFDLNHTLTSTSTPFDYSGLSGLVGRFTRTIYDHGNLLLADIDFNKNGHDDFIVVADLSVYIFENTGFNDEYRLIYSKDMGSQLDASGTPYSDLVSEFSTIDYTPDFGGQGPLLALSAGGYLFMMRYSSDVGFVETFQDFNYRQGVQGLIGSHDSSIIINTLLFADLNQDGDNELWVGGQYSGNFQTSGVLKSIEYHSGYMEVYSFNSALTRNNPINDLSVADFDSDGLIDLVIGHSKGIDIWEFPASNDFNPVKQSSISSDPFYGSSDPNPTFGINDAPEFLAARNHDIYELSTGNYVVTYRQNAYTNDSYGVFYGSNYQGRLQYAVVSDPNNLGDLYSNNNVSSDPFNLSPGAAEVINDGGAYYHLYAENAPSIIESGSGFYITWVSQYRITDAIGSSSGSFRSAVNTQYFDLNGNKLGGQFHVLDIGNYYPQYTSSTINPANTSQILVSYDYSGDIYIKEIATSSSTGYTPEVYQTYSKAHWGLDDYYIISTSLVSDPTSQINTFGIAFAGVSYANPYSWDIFYASYNTSSILQGVYQVTSGIDSYLFVDAVREGDDLLLTFERLSYADEVYGAYSVDSGRTWSEPYHMDVMGPEFTQIGSNQYITASGTYINQVNSFRPRITTNGVGGFTIHYVRFLYMYLGTSPSFTEDLDISSHLLSLNSGSNYYRIQSQLMTQNIDKTFFKFLNLGPVRDTAVGDTDNDGRLEILFSHENYVTLAELSSSDSTHMEFVQKWQSQPYQRQTGAVVIDDTNGNGWPEIIYTVRGGDVLAFEVGNIHQPKNREIYYSSNQAGVDTVDSITNITKSISFDYANDGSEDVLLAGEASTGLVVVNGTGHTLKQINDIGTVYNLRKIGNRIIVVTDLAVIWYNLELSEQSRENLPTADPSDRSIFVDIDGDSIPEIIVLSNTSITAYDNIGSLLWSNNEASPQDSGYQNLVSYESEGQVFFSFATGTTTSTLIYVVNSEGSLTTESYEVSLDPRSFTHSFGRFDSDDKEDILLEVYSFSTPQILIYQAETGDLLQQSPMLNLTIPSNDLLVSTFDGNNDGYQEVIVSTSQLYNDTTTFGEKGSSGVFVFDITSESLVWSRKFGDPIVQLEMVNDTSPYFLILTRNQGLFAISPLGQDLFWTSAPTSATSIEFQNQLPFPILVSSETGRNVRARVLGVLTPAVPHLTVETYLGVIGTISLYDLQNDISQLEVLTYVSEVDINGDGSYDLAVTFNNGTFTLRNFDLGEYYRLDIGEYNSIRVTSFRYSNIKSGLALVAVPGNLVILDRISSHILAQVSVGDYSGDIVGLQPVPFGDRDLLILQFETSTATTFALFDPVENDFIWDITYPELFSKVDLASIDQEHPGTATHLVLQSGNTISLEPLPNTLLDGGPFSDPSSGVWVDFSVFTNIDKLSSFYLVSSTGVIFHEEWTLSEGITSAEFATNLNNIESSAFYFTNTRSYAMLGSSTNYSTVLFSPSLEVLGSVIVQNGYDHKLSKLVDISGDLVPEMLVTERSTIDVYQAGGVIVSQRYFSNPIASLQMWYPDDTLIPVLLGVLVDQSVEIHDPLNREISLHLAPISQVGGTVISTTSYGSFISPDSSWTDYNPVDPGNRAFNPFWSLIFVPFLAILVLRRRKL